MPLSLAAALPALVCFLTETNPKPAAGVEAEAAGVCLVQHRCSSAEAATLLWARRALWG